MAENTMAEDAAAALTMAQRIYARLSARRGEIEKAERYYKGDQNLTMATAEWLDANAARYSGFSDNWCATIANAEAERIEHTGIRYRVDESSPLDVYGRQTDKVSQSTWDDWLRNEMPAQQSQGILTSLIARRSFVSVWSSDDEGTPQYEWEHPSNVEIEYDWMRPRVRKAAIKTWLDEKSEYLVLDDGDYFWKWQRPRSREADERTPQADQARQNIDLSTGGWVMWRPAEDDIWPVPNVLGEVSFVEVPNRPTLRGEPVSEIDLVMPMQDAINLLWAYLFLAADHASMPARVLTGAKPPMRKILDKDGKQVGEAPITMKEISEARFAVFSGDNAKIDQWDAAQLTPFTDVIEIGVGHIAAQTRTPPHYLVTNKGLSNLSGDALRSAEIGLVKKAGEFITFAEPNLREVHRLGHLVRGNRELAEQTRFASLLWRNPEIRSESQLSDALQKKRAMGYPLKYIMELDGVSPNDMGRIQSMIDEERAQDPLAHAARAFQEVPDASEVSGEALQESAA